MKNTPQKHTHKISKFLACTYLLSATSFAASESEAPLSREAVKAIVAEQMNQAFQMVDRMVDKKVREAFDADTAEEASTEGSEDSERAALNTPLKRLIHQYVPQVFNIEFSGEHGEHSGTGFMFNAAEGIIATNHHVVTSNMGRFKVILENGDEYSGKEIEVMGTSPSQQLGDFAFLRIAKLKGKFEQMPFVEDNSVKKCEPVAFMGNSEGSFSIQDGFVNGRYNFEMSGHIHAMQVHLHSNGGASGSPTFNKEGKINGILFGGSDDHTLILPIWFVQKAYAQMMGGDAINSVSLGSTLGTESIFEIAKFHEVSKETLRPYLPKDTEDEKKLLVMESNYKGSEGDELQAGDVILTVNENVIGCNSILLTELLERQALSTVKVLRLGEEKTLSVKPKKTIQSFMKRITLGHSAVCSVGSAIHTDSGIPLESALLMNAHSDIDEEDGSNIEGVVTAIGKTPTESFDSFARTLYQAFSKDEKHHLMFKVSTQNASDPFSMEKIDLSLLEGTELYVEQFDSTLHRWKKVSLKAYVDALERAVVL